MSDVESIERARRDRQIEADATSGKLDPLIERALADHRTGVRRGRMSVKRGH